MIWTWPWAPFWSVFILMSSAPLFLYAGPLSNDCAGPLSCGWTMDQGLPVSWFFDKDSGAMRTSRCLPNSCGLARLRSPPFKSSGQDGIKSFVLRYKIHGDSRVYLRLLIRSLPDNQEVKMWEQWANWGEPYRGRFKEQLIDISRYSGDVQLILETNIVFSGAFAAVKGINNRKISNSHSATTSESRENVSVTSLPKHEGPTQESNVYEITEDENANTDTDYGGQSIVEDSLHPDTFSVSPTEDYAEDESEAELSNGYTRAIMPKLCISQGGDH